MNLSTYGTDKSNTEIAHALLASHIRRKSKQAKQNKIKQKSTHKDEIAKCICNLSERLKALLP